MIFCTDYNIFLNRTKISGSLHEKVSIFVSWRQHKFELKYCCTTINIFISFSGTCLNSIHRKHYCASLTTMLKRNRHNIVVSYSSVLDNLHSDTTHFHSGSSCTILCHLDGVQHYYEKIIRDVVPSRQHSRKLLAIVNLMFSSGQLYYVLHYTFETLSTPLSKSTISYI